MSKLLETWTVLPHGELTEIDENILTVTGTLQMPLTEVSRRMTVVRLNDGRLVIFSAIALKESAMRQLQKFGRPAFLVVPNGYHRMDAKIWKARYPALQLVTPAGARARVEKTVAVDTSEPVFDATVDFITVPGLGAQEAALMIRSDRGNTLVLNDLIGNLAPTRGVGGWVLRALRLAGQHPQIPTMVKLGLVKDKKALRAQLLQWANLAPLKRILVSHGAPIEERPNEVLRQLAASLS